MSLMFRSSRLTRNLTFSDNSFYSKEERLRDLTEKSYEKFVNKYSE